MSNNLKQFGGILITLFAVAAIGCSSDSTPSGPGGGGANKEFVSGTLNQNDSYEHVFTKAATYHYFCSFHGTATTGMHGTITVGTAGTANKFQSNITASTLADFTIEIGDTIRWTNMTTMAHNVQSAE
jgi:plastocyanin